MYKNVVMSFIYMQVAGDIIVLFIIEKEERKKNTNNIKRRIVYVCICKDAKRKKDK